MTLSHPYNGETAVNNCIPPENAKVMYHHINEVIQMGLDFGRKVTGTCIHVWSTFRNLLMLHQMLRYLRFTLNGKYYINTLLPFRATCSCLIFEKVPSLIAWIVRNEKRRKYMSHYLDKFPPLGTALKIHSASSRSSQTSCFAYMNYMNHSHVLCCLRVFPLCL